VIAPTITQIITGQIITGDYEMKYQRRDGGDYSTVLYNDWCLLQNSGAIGIA
jgi:hypothetical protein